ncbi:PIR Superfamily Protein [Plasmodium ovale wallikeri]|uniref:PIR Superfamily Protein n=2 Tax=Plasmodium ovale TaxID=36330 RepID=A0A1A9A771_PLAOA|nr:PIR Superfamily Protein [Plasmodium ovale wallikeri]SBT55529.1 PIR Superfamily Protein [Plasmodium ovale wallikeri]SBT74120.1 Plasmodium vivax Vir protein, putative [Plasmodium ovale]
MVENVNSLVQFLEEFYQKMDESVEEEEISFDKGSLPDNPYIILKETLNKIARNYNHYKTHSESIPSDMYCRYLNYWLRQKKKIYDATFQGKHHQKFSQKIMEHFPPGKTDIYRNLQQCNIVNDEISYKISKIRKLLDDLYYVKKKLGGKDTIKKNKNICLEYNKYIYDTIYNIFIDIIPLGEDFTLKNSDFIIKDVYTQADLNDLFTRIRCEEENMPDANQDKLLTVGECTPDKCNCTDASTFLSVFVTFLGSVITLFLLYKFSPIGTWLYNRIRRKDKIINDLNNKERKYELEHNYNNSFLNSTSEEYNMPYISINCE